MTINFATCRYIATFPAGTFDIIIKQLKSFSLQELKIINQDNSSVTFDSSLTTERLIELRYFTNTYKVVEDLNVLQKAQLKGKYFRLMQLKNGNPVPLDHTKRKELESRIQDKLGLEPNTHNSRNDFYLIQRSGGDKLLTLRLSKARFKREELSSGELRPELAHILCLAAGVQARHLVADLFSGHGAVAYEVVRGFGCKRVVAVDLQMLNKRHEHKAIEWHQADVSNMESLAQNSVDRVIADPPWGIYDKDQDLQVLYKGSFKEIGRILKPGGVAVILSAYKSLSNILDDSNLEVIGRWQILVSGKKALILKLRKNS